MNNGNNAYSPQHFLRQAGTTSGAAAASSARRHIPGRPLLNPGLFSPAVYSDPAAAAASSPVVVSATNSTSPLMATMCQQQQQQQPAASPLSSAPRRMASGGGYSVGGAASSPGYSQGPTSRSHASTQHRQGYSSPSLPNEIAGRASAMRVDVVLPLSYAESSPAPQHPYYAPPPPMLSAGTGHHHPAAGGLLVGPHQQQHHHLTPPNRGRPNVFDQVPMGTEHDVLNHRLSPTSPSPLPVPHGHHPHQQHVRDAGGVVYRASSAVDGYYGHTARQLIPAATSGHHGHSHQQQHHPYHARAASTAPGHQVGKIQYTDRCNVVIEHRDQGSHQVVSQYRCGALLGTGGFAKVFDVVDLHTGERFACKIIDKTKLSDTKKRIKFFAEVDIHSRLIHPNILRFYKTFQDEWYHYMILERCGKESLMELSKIRGTFTTAEIQHIMSQLLQGVEYLHSKWVLHRDLKLGNIMVDAAGNMKIGDFGFATQLSSRDERKHTMCGTPNYIAPEVLGARASNAGYSYEVDTWSMGVILYTLAVGIPPFETKDLETTYQRIQACDFGFPPRRVLAEDLKALVFAILQKRPEQRLSLVAIRAHRFFKSPPVPLSAPLTLVALDADISPPASPLYTPNNAAYNAPAPWAASGGTSPMTPYSAPRRQDEQIPQPYTTAPSPMMRTGFPLFPPVAAPQQQHASSHHQATEQPGMTQAAAPLASTAAASTPPGGLLVMSSPDSSSSGGEATEGSREESPEVLDAAVAAASHPAVILPLSLSPSPPSAAAAPQPPRGLPPAPLVVITCFVSYPKYGYGFLFQRPAAAVAGSEANHPVAAALLNDRTKIVHDQATDKVWYYARVKGSTSSSGAAAGGSGAQDDDRGRSPCMDNGGGESVATATGFCDELHDYSTASIVLGTGATAISHQPHQHPQQQQSLSSAIKKFTIVKFLNSYMRGLRSDVVVEENPIFRTAIDSLTLSPLLFASPSRAGAPVSSATGRDAVYVKELHTCPLSELKFKELRNMDHVQSCTARLSDGSFQVSLLSSTGEPFLAGIAPAVTLGTLRNAGAGGGGGAAVDAAATVECLNTWTAMDLVHYGRGKTQQHLLLVLRNGSLTVSMTALDAQSQLSSSSSSDPLAARRKVLRPSCVTVSGGRYGGGGVPVGGHPLASTLGGCELLLSALLTRTLSDLLLNVGMAEEMLAVLRF